MIAPLSLSSHLNHLSSLVLIIMSNSSLPTLQPPAGTFNTNHPPLPPLPTGVVTAAGPSAPGGGAAAAPTATSTFPSADHPVPALPNGGTIVQQPVEVSTMTVTAPTDKNKCNCKGCPKLPYGHELLVCSGADCEKKAHHLCYANMIKKSSTQSLVFDDKVFCTVKHQEQFIKNTQSESLNWSNDGKNGRDDPCSSEKILVDYLNTGNNYNLFRSPEGGASKMEVATRIANMINCKGVRVERTGESVKNKIDHMQRMMRETCDFVNSATGEGILANEGYESFRDKVSFASPHPQPTLPIESNT